MDSSSPVITFNHDGYTLMGASISNDFRGFSLGIAPGLYAPQGGWTHQSMRERISKDLDRIVEIRNKVLEQLNEFNAANLTAELMGVLLHHRRKAVNHFYEHAWQIKHEACRALLDLCRRPTTRAQAVIHSDALRTVMQNLCDLAYIRQEIGEFAYFVWSEQQRWYESHVPSHVEALEDFMDYQTKLGTSHFTADDMCPICREPFLDEQVTDTRPTLRGPVVRLDCAGRHRFCRDCIRTWLLRAAEETRPEKVCKGYCPMDREEVWRNVRTW